MRQRHRRTHRRSLSVAQWHLLPAPATFHTPAKHTTSRLLPPLHLSTITFHASCIPGGAVQSCKREILLALRFELRMELMRQPSAL